MIPILIEERVPPRINSTIFESLGLNDKVLPKIGGVKNIPFVLEHMVDLADDDFDDVDFTDIGQKILSSDNLCDGSLKSEAVSGDSVADVLMNLGLNVTLFRTETDVNYFFSNTKKIDYILHLRKGDTVCKAAVETKRMSDFGGKFDLNDESIDKILNNANSKAEVSYRAVCDSDLWDIAILNLLVTDASVIDKVYDWVKKVDDCQFSLIVFTIVKGNTELIF